MTNSLNINGVTIQEGDHFIYKNELFDTEAIVISIESDLGRVSNSPSIKDQAVLLALPLSLPYFTVERRRGSNKNWDGIYLGKSKKDYLPDSLMAWQFVPWVSYSYFLIVEKFFVRKLKPEEYEIIS